MTNEDCSAGQKAAEEAAEEAKQDRADLRELMRPQRAQMRDAILTERGRGVQWLALAVLFSAFVAEVFDNDTPLRP